MGNFTDTDRRQMLAALTVQSDSRDFSAIFSKALRFWRDADEGLANMRASYDYFVVELLRQHHLKTDGLYAQLDQAWLEGLEQGRLALVHRKNKGGWWWLFYSWNPEFGVFCRWFEYGETWNAYKVKVQELVAQRAAKEVHDA